MSGNGNGWTSAIRPLGAEEVQAITDTARRAGAATEEEYRDPRHQEAARRAVIASWPTFAEFVDEIRALIARPPHFALLKNVPVDAPTPFFVAVTSSLGELVEPYRESWSRLIRHIRPETDVSREGYGVLNEYLHTDGTDWLRPNDLTCLLCERPDRSGGGRSLILPVEAFTSDIGQTDENLLDLVTGTPVPWLLADSFGGDVVEEPVLTPSRIRWLKYTVDGAVAAGARLSHGMAEALEQLVGITQSVSRPVDVLLEPGDLLLLDNTSCLHARTPITDPSRSGRVIHRIKVRL